MFFKIKLKVIHILILLIILNNVQIRSDKELSKIDPKIPNGTIVENGEAKFMVAFRWKSSGFQYCGGSLISRKRILSAAHCFFFSNGSNANLSESYITMGALDLYDPNALSFDIIDCIYHPNFDRSQIKGYDIAIVIFNGINLSENPNVEIMSLADRDVKVNENCLTYGWGITYPDKLISPNILLQANVNIIDFKECKKSYWLYGQEFCVGGPEDRGLSEGDSGGPLICNGKQAGIVSVGLGAGHSLRTHPILFTNVYKYKNWIKHNYKCSGIRMLGNSEIFRINHFLMIYLIVLWKFV